MNIEKFDVGNGLTVALCDIPGIVDYSDSACYGLRYLMSNVRSDNRRREIFTVNLLIKELFGNDCKLEHHKSGKPYLVSPENENLPQVSISHCRGMVAVAYGNKSVGVDIEIASDRVLNVKERVMNDSERDNAGSSILKNTIIWTVKEALFKLIPEDKVSFSSDLNVDISLVDVKKSENRYSASAFGRNYNIFTRIFDDIVLTVAY